jgi:WD40 repeat protein
MANRGQEEPEALGRFRRGPIDVDPADLPPKPRFPHPVAIRTAALSCDRKSLVALDAEGSVTGWDVTTAKRRYRRPAVAPNEAPQRLTLSPDGRVVVLSPRSLPSGLVRVLDARTGEELHRFDGGFAPSFSPDSQLMACSDGKQLRRWALKGGAELPRFPEAEEPLKWTAWSPTNDVIAASMENSSGVAIWDIVNRRRMFRGTVSAEDEAAASLAITPDGKTLAIGSHWGIRFFFLTGPPEKQLHGHEEYALGQLKFSADGRRMVALSRRRRLLVWETFTGKPLFTWAAFETEDGVLEISEGGDAAIWIERGGIRLERIPLLLAGYDDGHVVRNLCFTPTGLLVTGDDQGALRVWDPATQREIRRYSVPLPRLRYFSHDGAWAVFGGAKDPVTIWDLVAEREVLKVETTPAVQSMALSPDRARMALGHADGAVSIWSTAEAKESTRIPSDMAPISAVSWSLDGKSMAWGDEAGAVTIAEGQRGLETIRFRTRGYTAIRELMFTRDGKSVVATDARGVQRAYSDPGVEPKILAGELRSLPHASLLDPRWKASGYDQKRSLLGVLREVVSLDRTYIAGMTVGGKLVIWEAPGGK